MAQAVIRELGYPKDWRSVQNWYKEYQSLGGQLRIKATRKKRFSEEEQRKAVEYYLEHGKSIANTLRKVGYGSRHQLEKWIDYYAPDCRKRCIRTNSVIHLSEEEKEKAEIALEMRTGTAKEIAGEYGVTTVSLYKWKKQLLPERQNLDSMKIEKTSENTVEELRTEADILKAKVTEYETKLAEMELALHKAKLEKEVYQKAAEVLKKEKGVDLNLLTNREKAIIINTPRKKYSLNELLQIFNMAKSSYCYQNKVFQSPDKYEVLKYQIQTIFEENQSRYGYRRIQAVLRANGIVVADIVVMRIMKDLKLKAKRSKMHKYSSYKGEITPGVSNLINRDFHSGKPNEKWITDITEFSIPAGKVYLSPIIDCFDGMPVSWSIGTSPNADLANSMLSNAANGLKNNEHPIIHSDRGCHYRWPKWIELTKEYGLIRSMSRKGCSPDNSACEGFFGTMKVEMFYGINWRNTSIEQFIEIINEYMHWYAEIRIKISLGGLSPIQYRQKLGLI